MRFFFVANARTVVDGMRSLTSTVVVFIYLLMMHVTAGYILDPQTGRSYSTGKRLAPNLFTSVREFEEYASSYMDRHSRDYYNSGAGNQETMKDNKAAFLRYRIRPRLLRDVSRRDMSLTILGQPAAMPLGVSPVAFQKMVHPDGEIGTALAAANYGAVMILSTLATTSMEEITKFTPGAIHWLQVYIARDRDFTKGLIHRADVAGFKAIVVTVDSPVNGMWGVNMVHNLTLPPHLRLGNLQSSSDIQNGVNIRTKVGASLLDPSLTWKDLQWIQKFTSLPIVAKGVLTAEDAVAAVEHGASGILVSNHGGRQLDGVPATLDALPEIVKAVKGRAEVFLDGGVRSGSDVFKALALGAKAVFIGRPVIWGLTHSGREGVEAVFRLMKNQLDTTMALSGAASLADIQETHVAPRPFYS